MIRVVPVSINGIDFELATMSWKEAEAHSKAGQEMVEKLKVDPTSVPDEEWKARMFSALAASINKAGHEKHNSDFQECTRSVLEDYDKPTLEALYTKLLQLSGLMGAEVGGVQAA